MYQFTILIAKGLALDFKLNPCIAMCRLKHEVALEPLDASFTSSLIGQNAPVALESEAQLAVCELAGRLPSYCITAPT